MLVIGPFYCFHLCLFSLARVTFWFLGVSDLLETAAHLIPLAYSLDSRIHYKQVKNFLTVYSIAFELENGVTMSAKRCSFLLLIFTCLCLTLK